MGASGPTDVILKVGAAVAGEELGIVSFYKVSAGTFKASHRVRLRTCFN